MSETSRLLVKLAICVIEAALLVVLAFTVHDVVTRVDVLVAQQARAADAVDALRTDVRDAAAEARDTRESVRAYLLEVPRVIELADDIDSIREDLALLRRER